MYSQRMLISVFPSGIGIAVIRSISQTYCGETRVLCYYHYYCYVNGMTVASRKLIRTCVTVA